MPTYEDLRQYYEDEKHLPVLAGRAVEIPIVRGITLDVDPLWARLHDLDSGLEPQGTELWDEERGSLALPWVARQPGFRRRNLNRRIDRWQEIVSATQDQYGRERLPVLMTIVHRPLRPPLAGEGEQPDDLEQLRSLVRLVDESGVLVQVEERTRAQLAFHAGGKVVGGASGPGTLGGVLNDPLTRKSYGVTCEHVARKNDILRDLTRNTIGRCVEATDRVPLPGTVEDPILLKKPMPYPGNGPDMNTLDCALIDLSVAVTTPALGGVAAALTPGQWVTVSGAQSTSHCYLGSLAISYSFDDGNQTYCFCDSIELVPRPTGLLNRATAPQQGDSGAWVLTDDTPPVWAGLFYGEDGKRGFAVRASWVYQWAKNVVGPALTV